MNKKILCIALMVGVSVMGFAQTPAEQAVSDKHKELLEGIKRGVENFEKGKVTKLLGEAGNKNAQFLLSKGKPKSFFKLEKPTFKNVYKKLSKKSAMRPAKKEEAVPSEFSYFNSPVVEQGVTKSRFRTSSEIYTKAQKGSNISEVKCSVIFEWDVKFNTGKKAEKKPINKITLKSVKITDVNFFDSEKQQMQETADRLIKDYYQNLLSKNLTALFAPEVPQKAEVEKWLSESTKIEKTGDFTALPLPEDLVITTKAVPPVTIHLDPAQYMTEGDSLYVSKEAYRKTALAFKITIDKDDLKKGTINKVDYSETEFKKPEIKKVLLGANNQQQQQHQEALRLAQEFTGKLKSYTATGATDKDLRNALITMFEKQRDIVEVSNIRNNEIRRPSITEYCARLRKADMNFDLSDPVFENDMNIVIFPFGQKFDSRTSNYCDHTSKKIHMKYDSNKKTYSITKVTVVERTTKPCE